MKTNKLTVELRLGGVRPTSECRSSKFLINLPVVGKTITTVKTDNFALYIELTDGTCLIHSDTCIDADGTTSFELLLVDKTDFDEEKREWYDSDPDLKVIK